MACHYLIAILWSNNEAEQQEESMATGVETQTEAFDYLYRKM